MNVFSSSFVLIRREWKRFFRQRSRVISSLLTPVLFWALMGMGFGKSFDMPFSNGGYLEYFFPGVLLMTLLFSSIFSMISLIEDRNEGFLQSVLVSPISHASVVFGKILGAATLSIFQTLLLLPFSYVVGVPLNLPIVIMLLAIFSITAVFLCSLSFLFAWILNSTQGFHAVMNILLFPMWILSGAMFPMKTSSGLIQWIMAFNPLTYALDATRKIFYAGNDWVFSFEGMQIYGDFLLMACLCIGLVSLSFLLVKKSYQ